MSHPVRFEAGRKAGLTLGLCYVLLSTVSCTNSSEPCSSPSQQAISVFFEETTGPYFESFEARISALDRPQDSGFTRLTLTGSAESSRSLKFRANGIDLPVELGATYTWRIEYVPGFPSESGIMINDSEGLLFAAVGALTSGSGLQQGDIPGFNVEQRDRGCPVSQTTCYASYQEMGLHFTAGTEHRLLQPGETGHLGSYSVTCLVSRLVTYTSACADAGVLDLSYVIQREP